MSGLAGHEVCTKEAFTGCTTIQGAEACHVTVHSSFMTLPTSTSMKPLVAQLHHHRDPKRANPYASGDRPMPGPGPTPLCRCSNQPLRSHQTSP